MPSTFNRYRTSQFTEKAMLLAWGTLGLLGLAIMLSPLFQRKLLDETVFVAPEETARVGPIQPRSLPIGALRIDAKARLPNNTWSVVEVELLDDQDAVLASAIKQVWQESGTWAEGGETGTWTESDLQGRFDIRQASLDGPVSVAVTVLEQGTIANTPLEEATRLRLTVWDGAIDDRFLWSGMVGVLLLIGLAAIALKATGRVLITKVINDSDVGGRGQMGGPDQLVRVSVKVVGDETCPARLTAQLWIKDAHGAVVYRSQKQFGLPFRREDSRTGYHTADFILESPGSYGFYVEITPDGPVDRTRLTVKEGVRTLVPVDVVHIRS